MTLSPETRSSLLIRLGNSADDQAWQEFVQLYEPLVYRVARGRGLQDADARDVTQTVLERVSSHVSRWRSRPHGSFRAWLATIARNTSINSLVQQQRRRDRGLQGSGDSRVQRILGEVPVATDESFDRELKRQIFIRAAELVQEDFKPTTWTAFWETCVNGRSAASVAEQLGLSLGNVYVARSRCLARLREQVKELERWA